jgi:hypothetical protein
MDIAQASEIVSVTGADVWSAQASVFASVGSMGELLNDASAAGDPWAVDLPGSYTGLNAGAMLSTMSINTASTVVAVASVLANYAQASAVTAVKVETASMLAKIDIIDTVADTIKADTASTVVAIASVLANYAQASTVIGVAQATVLTTVKVETASMLARIIDIEASRILVDTTIQSANRSTTACQLTAGSVSNNAYIGMQVVLNNKTTTEMVSRTITAYTGSSKLVTWTPALTENAQDGGQIYIVTGDTKINVTADEIKVDTASTVVAIASVRANMGYASTETTILNNTTSTIINITSVLTRIAEVKVDTASTVVAIASVLANYAQASTVIGVAQASAIAAVVNAQVLDVLNVDTFAEPGQGAPAATTTLIQKLGYIFKFARNKLISTSTTVSIYADDAVTVDQKATVSDDGTTFTRGEIGTGP